MTATAATCWQFVNWTGDITSTQNPLPITITSNMNITANFEEVLPSSSATLPPPIVIRGGKIVHDCGNIYRAVPHNRFFHFKDWTDAEDKVVSARNPIDISQFSYAPPLTANFIVYWCYLVINHNESVGSVTIDGLRIEDNKYILTSAVYLEAKEKEGYRFVGWYDKHGNFISDGKRYFFPITVHTELEARFERQQP